MRILLCSIAAMLLEAPRKKEGAENGGGANLATAPLDLPPGPGVSPVKIKELDDALADYKEKRDARCDASKLEVPAKELVLTLMHKYAEQLHDDKGTLRYKFQDGDELKDVYIEAAKEKIKFGKTDTNAEGEPS